MTRTLLIIAAATGVAFGQTATAAGDAAAGKEKAAQCQSCHGLDGNSPTPQFPKIGGQHAKYIVQTLEDYKTGARQDPIMGGILGNPVEAGSRRSGRVVREPEQRDLHHRVQRVIPA